MCNCNRRHKAVTSASLAAAREMAQGTAEERAMQSVTNAIGNANSGYVPEAPSGETISTSS